MQDLNKKLRQKWFKILIGICVTSLALWLSFRKVDWDVLKESFLHVNSIWVSFALANTILSVYALGWRWQILLKPKIKIPLGSLFRLNIISQYVNIIIPGRFGEVLRAYLISKQHKVSGGYVTGTIIIEKILDFFVFVFLWISIPFFFAMEKEVKGFRIALFFCLLATLLLFLFIWRPKIVLKWTRALSLLFPKRLRQVFQAFCEKGIEAFGMLRSAKILAFVVLLTFGFIAGQVLTIFLLFKAFNLNLSFWVGLFLLLAIQVGSIPPSAPGKIGVIEYAVILALSLFTIPKSQALSYGIMLHLVAFLPKIILGLIFLPSMDISLKKGSKLLGIKYEQAN